ncbi:hypothetical protein SALINJAH_214 [Bacillus phage SalinJah]|uniref:Uncharacterized protein n=1 Tax=Bacillus phage SalinJah TaxID=1837830 RepID=A0A173GBM1_9CAUD|nr:hypothetical protein SALINJAH_214 [Bacillus phage SalinJah]ANH50771.1 hypothetical protein SALINJAH_214 [Bacillus phage SalinJah]
MKLGSRSIEIPSQRKFTSVIRAYDMRKTSVANMLKQQGFSEQEITSFLMEEVEKKAVEGYFSFTLDKEFIDERSIAMVLFNNFSQYMILTRQFREAGYTVTPSYKHNGDKQVMAGLTISWSNAVEKF